MQLTKKIAFSVVLLLLTAVLTAVYGQSAQEPTPSPLERMDIGMTIFDSNTIFVENNSLALQNGFTTVLNNANSLVLSAITAPPPQRSVAKSGLNQTKQGLNKPFVVVKTPRNKNKITPQFIAWGNLPFGNNSLYNGANFCVGIVPSTNTKLQITNDELRVFDSSAFDLRLLTYDYKKQQFHSLEIVQISNNYSKTSRIRPPPTFSC